MKTHFESLEYLNDLITKAMHEINRVYTWINEHNEMIFEFHDLKLHDVSYYCYRDDGMKQDFPLCHADDGDDYGKTSYFTTFYHILRIFF